MKSEGKNTKSARKKRVGNGGNVSILEEAKRYRDLGYKTYPVYTTEEPAGDAETLLRVLKRVSAHAFLLESTDDAKNSGRYTFLGFEPKCELTCRDGKMRVSQGIKLEFDTGDPRPYIRKALRDTAGPRIEGLPPFTGGLVGYFAFDYIKYSEPTLVFDGVDEEKFNDVDLMLFDRVIALDNLENKRYYIVNISLESDIEREINRADAELEFIKRVCHGVQPEERGGKLLEDLKPLFSKEEYCGMVERAKKYIYEGDIFQCVPSNRWSARYEGNLLDVYADLKVTNPSPYMFYFAGSEVEIAGASPETLVKLVGDVVTTYPIAGSRPRGRTEAEDKALEAELLADEKELAEHNMLVDLGRNDLGKVCEFGSVRVDEYMNIERYSCIMHIGSTVRGKLKKGLTALDALDAVLPAGTLSGAPKIRACEIINELENNKRGIYGGAIGYLSFNGDMDTCISIRLAYKKDGKVFVRSGGGVVADSVPVKEYEESCNKAKAVVRVLRREV